MLALNVLFENLTRFRYDRFLKKFITFSFADGWGVERIIRKLFSASMQEYIRRLIQNLLLLTEERNVGRRRI